MERVFKLPQRAWFGETEREIFFPSGWELSWHGIGADGMPVLDETGIHSALTRPLGCPPLRELARGRLSAAIIFDDMTRPTPVSLIVPHILEELRAAGITGHAIRFIAALGNHGALTRQDFVKKLGEEIVGNYPVYNHNPYENCTVIGTTSRGTTVAINSEVADCDVKIGVGCLLPHPMVGFGGGGKIILPGVASIDTVQEHHMMAGLQLLQQGLNPSIDGTGRIESNEGSADIDEAARLAGLDFKVDALVNSRRQLVGLLSGRHDVVFREGVRRAERLYATPRPGMVDVVVANANAKASEAHIAVLFGAGCLKEEGGDVVLIADSPAGQVAHYLFGAFGNDRGGRLWNAQGYLPDKVRRVIVLTDYPDYTGGRMFAPPQLLTWCNSWDDVLRLLNEAHPGGGRAAVFVDATMQYFSDQH